MKIVVVGGGTSTERQVSLVTSTSVCKALRRRGHKAIFVDLYLGVDGKKENLNDLFDSEDSITADDIAQLYGSIGYELVCGIGKRVERFYIGGSQDGEEEKIPESIDC